MLTLPLLILIAGILLRRILPAWFPIPEGILVLVLIALALLLLLLLLVRRAGAGLRYLMLAVAALTAACGIALVAALTRDWPALWAWLTVLTPLCAMAAAAGLVLGLELVYRCKQVGGQGPNIVSVHHRGPVKLLVTESLRPPGKKSTGRGPYRLRQAGPGAFSATTQPAQMPVPNIWNGPFSLDEFSEIQILLQGEVARWYYNSYFDLAADADLYARYFLFNTPAGQHQVPSGPDAQTPSPDGAGTAQDPKRPGAETGEVPAEQGPQGILMTLKSVHYSSRYGGSVRLVFEMSEDYFYELRFDPYVYDLSSLNLSVYVVPSAEALNPLSTQSTDGGIYYPRPTAGGVFLEYRPEVKAAYALIYPNTELGGTPSPPEGATADWSPPEPIGMAAAPDHLAPAWSEHLADLLTRWQVEHQSAGSYDPPLSFVYGLLHHFLTDALPNETARPTRISITDNDLDLHTRQGEFSFSVSCQVSDLSMDCNGDNVWMWMRAQHDWAPAMPADWEPGEEFPWLEWDCWCLDYPDVRHSGWYPVFRYSFTELEEFSRHASRSSPVLVSIQVEFQRLAQILGYLPGRGYGCARYADTGDLGVPLTESHLAPGDPGPSVYDLAEQGRGGTVVDTTVKVWLRETEVDDPGTFWTGGTARITGTATIRLVAHLRIC